MNYRLVCAHILEQVLKQNASLTNAWDQFASKLQANDHAKAKHLCYAVCRWYFRLDFFYKKLVNRQVKPFIIKPLLLIALYQLSDSNRPDYAVVNETVGLMKTIKQPRLTGFINAVLRNFCRQQKDLMAQAEQSLEAKWAHPLWLIKKLQQDHPDKWQEILKANNTQAPMFIRVNTQNAEPLAYKDSLDKNNLTTQSTPIDECLQLLDAVPVQKLPKFIDGDCYVQDLAGQYAAHLLDLKPDQRVLDACAAPGSKTTHIYQLEPVLQEIVALDQDPERLKRVKENWQRLQFNPAILTIKAADATQNDWWDGQCFDRILLDAPCSATGVIRRHPDIKLLRRESDINTQVDVQLELLKTLWGKLKPGGLLLYSTCSLLKDENIRNIERFVSTYNSSIKALPNGQTHWQLLPEKDGHDGFFYTLLYKPVDNNNN